MTPARLRWGLGAVVTVVCIAVVWSAFTPIPHSGGDNAGYIALAHALVTDGQYVDAFDPERMKHTKYPPVFPALLAIMIMLGARTWATLKLAAVVPTILAVAATYVWAERRAGAWVAFSIALLVTLSSAIIYYSHWILSDPLFLALSMIALAAFTLSTRRSDGEAAGEPDGAPPNPAAEERGVIPAAGWLAAGLVATGLAYFTRSAGLPLVVAALAWLALERRWRTLAVASGAFALPMGAWWLRGRGEGVAQYGTEFWMVNPYDPAAGTIGVTGLLPRIVENGSSYVLQHVPAGIVGGDGPALGLIGGVVALAALVGWALALRERVGVAEIFFPLYAGLILVWPSVWGGDRFALPLYPLAFLYGAVALKALARRLPPVLGPPLGAIAVLLLALPAGGNLLDENRQSAACKEFAAQRGVWACYGPRIVNFVSAASWSAEGLPADAAVLSRKPRHFYLLSGHPSRTFPFEGRSAAHLELADQIGARWVLLDQWDGLAARHVGAAVRERPSAFCYMRAFGDPAQGGAQLLGIRAPEERGDGGAAPPENVGITVCPGQTAAGSESVGDYASSERIPLLAALDS